MRSVLAIVAVLFASPVVAAEKPNVLFIAIDDLNDWVGPLGGHPQVKTPNIDKLAARGTTFTNAHCQAPLCNPSRTSILTGLRPTSTGVYALTPWFRNAAQFKQHATIFQWFRKHGYTTLTGGKVFHDSFPPKDDRKDNGPEVDVWGSHGGFGPRPKVKFVTTPDNMAAMDWGIFPENDEFQADWQIADAAIAIHACRLMALDAAAKQDAGHDVRTEASMIKVFATEMASLVIDRAMQVFGAMGMTKETPLQLMAQKVRTMRVYEGPTEVHRMVVARRQLAQGR